MREALNLIREAIGGHQRPSSGLELVAHLMREALNLIREAIKGHQAASSSTAISACTSALAACVKRQSGGN
jgi:hypothetical protein